MIIISAASIWVSTRLNKFVNYLQAKRSLDIKRDPLPKKQEVPASQHVEEFDTMDVMDHFDDDIENVSKVLYCPL